MFKRFFGGATVSALALLASAPIVQAQETTATIRGEVVNESGAPVSGARVMITHVPTGTRVTQQTNADGVFDARGLRIGGPYTIEVSAANFGSNSAENVFVSLGDPLRVTIPLARTDAEVVVTAQRRAPIIRGLNTGASTTFTDKDVKDLPSIGRDPKDIARLDPFVNIDASNSKAVIFSGTNSRFNSFTVDSVRQNDEFGLNNSGYPTQRSPVSIDAIGGISVRSAPYDVKYNDFTGGNINVVTKSGANKFTGSIFGDLTNDKYLGQQRTQIRTVGTGLVREEITSTVEFEEKTWGATLGGPIIKDRLFFFASYEKFDATRPFQSGPADTNRPVVTNNTTSSQVRTVQAILAAASGAATSVTVDGVTTSLAAGGYGFGFDQANSILGSPALEEADKKVLAKLDWNIISGHRASFTYQDTFGDRLVEGNRGSATLLPLLSHYYTLSDSMKAYNLQLVSNWTDNLSTEVIFNRKEIERGQIPIGGASKYTRAGDDPTQFAQFEIDGFGTGTTSSIFAGPDRSRHSNELDNTTDTFVARAEYTFGEFKFLGGYERKSVEVRNLFVQDSEGRVNFAGIAGLASRTPTRIRYQNAIRDVNGDGLLNGKDSEVNWGYQVNSWYGQTSWDINDALTVLAGLRLDQYQSDERPQQNNFFQARYGFSNAKNLDGLEALLPRLGFNYKAESFGLSGGVGKFSGGSPGVWVSNNYSNDGLTLGFVDCGTAAAGSPSCSAAESTAFRTNFNGLDLPAGLRSILTDATRLDTRLAGRTLRETLIRGNGTNALAPNFKPPATWKANLQFDTELGRGENPFKVRAGALLTQVEDALVFVDLRAGSPIGVLPDGRPRYQSARQRFVMVDPALAATNPGLTNTGTDILLRNTDKGWSQVYTVGIGKEWANGIEADYSYTRTRAKDVQPGTSSVAFSNYQNYATRDPQGEELATSNYEIRDSHKLRIGWGAKLFGDNETRVTVFGEHRSGLPFSYTMRGTSDDVFGDVAQSLAGGTQGRQLLFVPNFAGGATTGVGCSATTPCFGIVQFANVATATALQDFVNSSGLAEWQGQVAPRNGFRSENVTKFDLRLSQELPAFVPSGAKVRAYMDVENVGNLINTKWGQIEQIEFPQVARLVDTAFDAANNRYVYSAFAPAQPGTSNADAANRSVWQIKFGLAYSF
ncbi:MAG: carboxypeptidase regulatory-like domain-containing protein [Caulobacterales bacterium]